MDDKTERAIPILNLMESTKCVYPEVDGMGMYSVSP